MSDLPEQIGMIGGSGLYSLEHISDAETKRVNTDYGDAVLTSGRWHKHKVHFVTRHGPEHSLPPHLVNYRANAKALAEAGAGAVLCINCVGGIKPAYVRPGTLCAPDQLLDFTQARESTFFTEGNVKHVDMTDPCDLGLREAVLEAGQAFAMLQESCCYATMQGPRLETRAEVNFLDLAGAHVVGMTATPEVPLLRELELPVAIISLVVNAAAGRSDGPIDDIDVQNELASGMQKVQQLIDNMLQ